ncbi:MAG: TolC family protein [Gemmatimonadetes bacterium]|nr:TolC family protein [Gemmatimonadota bacterium]
MTMRNYGGITLMLAALAGGRGATAQEVFTLEAAVQMALEQNEDLRGARYGLVVAQEQASEARSDLFPTIDLNASYARNLLVAENFLPALIFDPSADPDALIPVRFGADNVWSTNITVEQALFKPSVFVALGAASRFENFEQETLRGRTQEIVTGVRLLYYGLLLAQEQARLVENSVQRVRESLHDTRALNKAGLVADYDVLRLEVELGNLEPNLFRARNSVAQARRELGIELALDDLDGVRVAGSLAEIDLDDFEANSPENREILGFSNRATEPLTEDVMRRAREGRSDLRQLSLSEQLRQSELSLERVQYLPEVVLFGSYGVLAQQNGNPSFFGRSNERTFSSQVGLRVTWPIFSGFSKDARIDQKRASLRQAEAVTRVARSRADNEVETVWDQMQEARARADAQRRAVQQAQRGFEIASAQYREGLGSQLELTDSEVALRQSEFNYAQAAYDFLVAQANFDLAVGSVPMVDSGPLAGRLQ